MDKCLQPHTSIHQRIPKKIASACEVLHTVLQQRMALKTSVCGDVQDCVNARGSIAPGPLCYLQSFRHNCVLRARESSVGTQLRQVIGHVGWRGFSKQLPNVTLVYRYIIKNVHILHNCARALGLLGLQIC